MIKRAISSSALAWLASFLILTGYSHALSHEPGISWPTMSFFALWTGFYLAVTCVVVVIPLYLWTPDKVRCWGMLPKALVGASAGALAFFLVVPRLSMLDGAVAAAMTSGSIVGMLLPPRLRQL